MSQGRRGMWCVAGALGALLAASPMAASAATVNVTSGADSGPGTLRQALSAANNGDVIRLRAGTHVVSSGHLLIQDAVTIRGLGARRSIVRSDGGSRVFLVDPGLGTVTFSGITITGGDAGAADGGGISASSSVNLTAVALLNNRTDAGGSDDGGGIHLSGTADGVVRDSLIAGNTGYNGGGIYANDGLTLVNTTMTNNTAGTPNDNGWGGAGQLNGTVQVQDSTIVGNRDFGGVPDHGGGFVYGDITFANSIVAANLTHEPNGVPAGPGNPGVLDNCAEGTYVDAGHNIEDLNDCGFGAATSSQNTAPKLGALRNNGGQTNTMAVLRGSPALNRGSGCEATDQRGAPRRLGGRCDVGAYELLRCARAIVNRVGTAGRDKLVGTSLRDGILGLGGKDVLKGRAGNDSLCGGKGRDRLLAGRGRDKLLGQAGGDRLLGQAGRDLLLGGRGRDFLLGGPGLDRLRGGPGRDFQRQ